jgi:pSer/pThr/pTyr-binding forkhead associated (FHA) protein
MSAASTYLRLEVISGNALGETIVVDDELVIGRHATGPGRLSEDDEISRQHARISREATGDYAIEDLDSSNGTFVNGLRIQSPRLLSLGDSIETGATTLVVRAIVRPEPVEAPPPDAAAPPAPDLRSAPTVFARIPDAQPAPAPPAAALKLEIDFDAREARIALGEGGETVRLVFADGIWRASPADPDPETDPTA